MSDQICGLIYSITTPGSVYVFLKAVGGFKHRAESGAIP